MIEVSFVILLVHTAILIKDSTMHVFLGASRRFQKGYSADQFLSDRLQGCIQNPVKHVRWSFLRKEIKS